MKSLSDTLAVAWNFNHIDQNFTLADHSAFMDAAGIDEAQDLENLINGLHEQILGDEKDKLWEGIYNISNQAKDSGAITSLVDLSPAEILTIYNQSEANKKGVIYSALAGMLVC